jgi:peptide/nickel transport system substrate-binding protein
LDRKKFLEEVMHGHGIQVAAYQYYFGPAYDHSLQPYPYDPEKARQLLLEAGWFDHDGDGLRDKNGQPFRFEYMIPTGSAVTERRAAIMKENLRKLGIDMTIRQLEWATFIQDLTERRFDACYLCWAGDIESDPYQIWHTSQAEGRGSNFPGFGNAETDGIIEESRRTLDDEKRRELLKRFDRILHETQPYMFLYLVADLAAYDKRYRGVKFYKPRPGYDLTEWFLPKDSDAP